MSIPVPLRLSDRVLRSIRLPLVPAALAMILFYTVVLITWVPNHGYVYQWGSDGGLRIVRVLPDPAAAALLLQAGDHIVAIDGRAVVRSPWRWLFAPGQDAHTYTLRRGEEHLQVTLPTGPLPPYEIRWRLLPGLVSLGAWGVGSAILLLATRRNRAAWQVGLVTLGLAVALAASEASLYGVPTAWLLSDPWLPLLAVAFARLALLPDPPLSGRARRAFGALYATALLLAILHIGEIVILAPQGRQVGDSLALPLADLSLLAVGLALLLNPLLLGVRAWVLPPSHERRQVRLLLTFTLLAILPLTLLSLLPRALVGEPYLAWEVGIGLLLLMPLGYGYVIYRRNYLGLDLIATRTLTLLVLGLLFLVLHMGVSLILAAPVGLPEPWSTPLAAAVAGAGVLATGRRCGRRVRILVYGASIGYAEMVGSATAQLAQHPERATLEAIFAEMVALLEVQQAVLLLGQEQGNWTPIFCRGVGEEPWPVAATWPLHLQVRPEKGPSPACFYADWIEVAAPLVCDGSLVGVALLGPRVPDACFNRLELAFVEQMVGAMAMTASTLRLFEASRAMSRRLLHVQERERTYLASLLHDEPLQRLTLLAGRMDALACQAAGTAQTAPLAAEVQGQREALLLILRQLRHICAGLHSPLLDQSIGLAVQDAVEELARESDLDVWAQIELHPEQLVPEPAGTALYHVLLEALTNVRKHARATSVNVTLACQEGTLTLSVEDDGCGFDLASASLSDLVRRHHFGLVGMHEWARLAYGRLTLQPRLGGGTRVLLTVPLHQAAVLPAGAPAVTLLSLPHPQEI